METLNFIDVTVIEPRLKHPTIFEMFDKISAGESMVIHNDHDPKPLYYQLLGERGKIFNWEYILEGPEIWEVKISKLKPGDDEKTIGELVTKDFRKAEVFKKYGIDFCCGGKKTLTQACKTKGIDVLKVEKELADIDGKVSMPSQNFNQWDLAFLADYIINTHHNYVKQAIPVLQEYTQKVSRVHGNHHPEVIIIAQKFLEVAEELEMHMHKEEAILFPYIKELAKAQMENSPAPHAMFGTIKNPISMMENEHDLVGNLMHEIAELTSNYQPPVDACTTYRISFAKLKEFEDDLHQHIHLENNILFLKAAELEEKLNS